MNEEAEMFWAEDDGDYGPGAVSCSYCGTYPLVWVMTANGWRMKNLEGDIHSCHQYRKAQKECSK